MLAEPRRKVRIGPNPRGKFFQEDEDNRGRQMLMKMGWKTGDGLGSNCHGMSEPIKPKVNTDSRGLGYDRKQDPWVAHNEEFEQLLKNLNSGSGDEANPSKKGTDDDSGNSSSDGLEKKSKGSRSRIHYHKFVKNKDLSKASFKDMSGIFGKSLDATVTVAVTPVVESEYSTEATNFKTEDPCDQDAEPMNDPLVLEESYEDENSKRTKKKKKKRNKENEVLEENENNLQTATPPSTELETDEQKISEGGNVGTVEAEDKSITKEKKKKRNKDNEALKENENNLETETSSSADLEIEDQKLKEDVNVVTGKAEDETITTKDKKKKKKRNNESQALEEEINLEVPSAVESEIKEDDAVMKDKTMDDPDTKEKKKKKKHKRKSEDEPIIEETEVLVAPMEAVNIKNETVIKNTDDDDEERKERKKKKKSKKRKREEDDEECQQTETTPEAEVPPETEVGSDNAEPETKRKKKKKSKKERQEEKQNEDKMDEEGHQLQNEPNKDTTSPPPPPQDSEKLGSMQFINRGSIDDYFKMKMLQMKQRLAAKSQA